MRISCFVKGSGVGVLQLWDYRFLNCVFNLVLQKQHSLGELNQSVFKFKVVDAGGNLDTSPEKISIDAFIDLVLRLNLVKTGSGFFLFCFHGWNSSSEEEAESWEL